MLAYVTVSGARAIWQNARRETSINASELQLPPLEIR